MTELRSTAFQRWLLPALFLAGGAIAIFVVRMAPNVAAESAIQWAKWWHFAVVGFVAAGMFVGVLMKWPSRLAWEAIFTIAAFLGVWYVTLLLGLPVSWSLAISSILTFAHLFLRLVIVHDFFFLLGGVGVALNFAFWLPSEVLVVGLVVLTVYDMVAGPPGGPIEALASKLVRFGIVPGYILPSAPAGFGTSIDRVLTSRAILLGIGDLILPLMLVARAAVWGAVEASCVLAGLVLGALVLGHRRDLHPRAALVPLAVGTAVPFLVFFLLTYL